MWDLKGKTDTENNVGAFDSRSEADFQIMSYAVLCVD